MTTAEIDKPSIPDQDQEGRPVQFRRPSEAPRRRIGFQPQASGEVGDDPSPMLVDGVSANVRRQGRCPCTTIQPLKEGYELASIGARPDDVRQAPEGAQARRRAYEYINWYLVGLEGRPFLKHARAGTITRR